MRRAAAAALLVVLGGAARNARAASWVEVKGAGFTVVSDGGEKEARAVLGQFAQVRALMKRVWPWARVDPGRPVFILAVRDEAGLRRLLPEYWEKKDAIHPAGVFLRAPDRHWVALRMDVARGRAEDETWGNPYHLVFHEYVHLVLHLNFGALPGWLDEGLAEYWGSTIISGERIYEGRYIGYHIQTLRHSTLLPVERVLSAGSEEFSDANRATMLYAQSWALVHYLLLGARPAEGADRPVRRAAARRPAGGRRPARGLRRRRRRSAASSTATCAATSFRSIRTQAALDATTGPVSTRAVPEAESLALRAAFHVASRASGRAAAALAAEALKLDPSSAAAHEALALAAWRAGRAAEALAELEKAVATPGASDFAHYLHGRLLWSDSGRESAPLDRVVASLRHAIELNPAFAEAARGARARARRDGAGRRTSRCALAITREPSSTRRRSSTALRPCAWPRTPAPSRRPASRRSRSSPGRGARTGAASRT